jgi:branched-subunit amino acid aminotransferase/4-amino-4-deoxychorismate lyase
MDPIRRAVRACARYGSMGLNPMDAPVGVTIACREWCTYLCEDGMRIGICAEVSSWRRISSWRRMSPDSLIPHAKASGQYLNDVLAKIEAMKAGYQEAILLDDHGHVCEGTGENIHIVTAREIVTPGHHSSILDCIPAADRATRRRLWFHRGLLGRALWSARARGLRGLGDSKNQCHRV